MKEKKHKYLEDLLDEYLQLSEEQTEIPAHIEKYQKKIEQHLSGEKNITYKTTDAEHLFKYHNQVKRYEERRKEINDELGELENSLKRFLMSLQGGKISYDRKDDNDKSKNTYIFGVEGDAVKYYIR